MKSVSFNSRASTSWYYCTNPAADPENICLCHWECFSTFMGQLMLPFPLHLFVQQLRYDSVNRFHLANWSTSSGPASRIYR